jgi:hypothetical protein
MRVSFATCRVRLHKIALITLGMNSANKSSTVADVGVASRVRRLLAEDEHSIKAHNLQCCYSFDHRPCENIAITRAAKRSRRDRLSNTSGEGARGGGENAHVQFIFA